MKTIFAFVTFLLALSAWAGPFPSSGKAFDFTKYPRFPGPWVVVDGKIRDAEQKLVRAPGVNLTGYAALPATDAEAARDVEILDRMGVRAVRTMSLDWVIRPTADRWRKQAFDRFRWYAAQRNIVVVLDIYTEWGDRPTQKRGMFVPGSSVRAGWKEYAQWFLTSRSTRMEQPSVADDPNVVGICPVNEDVPTPGGDVPVTVTQAQYKDAFAWEQEVIRSTGYRGLIWGANSGIPAGWLLDQPVDTKHEYWDHPFLPRFKATSGLSNRTILWPNIGKPKIMTEYGSLWPNWKRSETETAHAGFCADNGVQMALAFALGTNANWRKETPAPLDSFAFHSDPIRMSTFRIMVMALAGQPSTSVSWNKTSGQYLRKGSPLIEVMGSIRWSSVGSLNRDVLVVGSAPNGSRIVYTGQDAQMTGFQGTMANDYDVTVTNRGVLPIVTFATERMVDLWIPRPAEIWTVDPFTGDRLSKVPWMWAVDHVKFQTSGLWVEIVPAPVG